MRRTGFIIAAITAIGTAAGGLAAGGEDAAIPPEEWRAMAVGKTVYYAIDGTYFGREYYWPDRDMVTFQHASGRCVEGRWTYEDSVYCFYFDRPNCFAHVRRGGGIVIVPRDSSDPADEQDVMQIVPVAFSCTPGLTS